MAAVYTELSIDQGTTYTTVVSVTDADTGLPIDLSDFTASSQLRTSYFTNNPTANFTCDMADSANGNVAMSMDANTTSAIDASERYYFDLVLKNANNSIVMKPVYGIVTVNPGVTR